MWDRTFFSVVGLVAVTLFAIPEASSATRFGSVVTENTEPANAGTGRFCNEANQSAMCSWVMTLARNAPPSRALAPKTGFLKRIRLVACFPGTFVLQIARANPTTKRAGVVTTKHVINYGGDPNHCDDPPHLVESFPISVPVTVGDRLSVVATKVGFLYCAGDNGSLQFNPPLQDGRPLRTAFDDGDCIMLLEAEYND